MIQHAKPKMLTVSLTFNGNTLDQWVLNFSVARGTVVCKIMSTYPHHNPTIPTIPRLHIYKSTLTIYCSHKVFYS